MNMIVREEVVRPGPTGIFRTPEDSGAGSGDRVGSTKWPLRWVTLSVFAICSAFWTAVFVAIF